MDLEKKPERAMELLRLLSGPNSRNQRDLTARWIGADSEKISAAVYVLHHGTDREMQRVAWVISAIFEKYPALAAPHLPRLVARLINEPVHDAVKRNLIRIFSLLPIPEPLHADLIGIALSYLASPGEAIAVKSFSMSVLYQLSLTYPEIGREVKALLELEMEKIPSPGIKSKAQKILSLLKKAGKR